MWRQPFSHSLLSNFMKKENYRIEYTRNDKANLEWREWAFGYPNWEIASNECKRLKEKNKDFDFKIVKDSRD